jgi:ABC-type cobalamin/Fe3+-siderophores transport system ATPase subunit
MLPNALAPKHVLSTDCINLAGKTSLLNALAGKAPYARLTGRVLFNSVQLRPPQVKKLIGYVPQEDIVAGDLTVLVCFPRNDEYLGCDCLRSIA